MLSIKFLTKDKTKSTVITTFFDIEVKQALADTSTCIFSIPYNQETVSKLTKEKRKVGNFVEVWVNLNEGRNIFSGIISKTKKKGQYMYFEAIDCASYYKAYSEKKKRLGSKVGFGTEFVLWVEKPCPFYIESTGTITPCPSGGDIYYTGETNYKGSMKGCIEYYHNLRGITEFGIGANNDTTYIETNIVYKEYTFYDLLEYLRDEFGVYRRMNGYTLDFVGSFEETQRGLWKYDSEDTNGSDIIDFEREESLDSVMKNDEEDNYPSIEVEDKERYKYKVGQKKAVQIRTQLQDGDTGFVGLITEIGMKANATSVSGTIKVDKEPRKLTKTTLRNVLDNLHKREIKIDE